MKFKVTLMKDCKRLLDKTTKSIEAEYPIDAAKQFVAQLPTRPAEQQWIKVAKGDSIWQTFFVYRHKKIEPVF